MTNSTDQERQAFEAFVRSDAWMFKPDLSRNPATDDYWDIEEQTGWISWQARAQQPASVAVPEGLADRIESLIPDGDGYNSEYANTLAETVEFLRNAAAPHPVSGEQKQACPVIRHVRPHSHKCANVQLNATSDTACDCGAVVNGVAVEVAPAAQDVAGLVEALEAVIAADWSSGAYATDFAVSQVKGHLIAGMKRTARKALAAHRAKQGEQ